MKIQQYFSAGIFFSRPSFESSKCHDPVSTFRWFFGPRICVTILSWWSKHQPSTPKNFKSEASTCIFRYTKETPTNQKEESTTTTIKPSNDLKTFIELSIAFCLFPTYSSSSHHLTISPSQCLASLISSGFMSLVLSFRKHMWHAQILFAKNTRQNLGKPLLKVSSLGTWQPPGSYSKK